MIELITLALGVVSKSLDKFPNYDQRKKEQFHKLRKKLAEERMKEQYCRDDNEIVKLEQEVKMFLQDFNSYLDTKGN